MTRIRAINCGSIRAAGMVATCRCLLLEDAAGLTLIDTGIGVADARDPEGRVGRELIDAAGFVFDEADTAVARLAERGYKPEDVQPVILTHGDPDHAGGLADFPQATVHLSAEERDAISRGSFRYRVPQFAHGVDWRPVERGPARWFGLPARRVPLRLASEVLLVPLFGHTLGHCGVAVQQGDRWVLHVGDAYYLRAELDGGHPVSALAAARAEDDAARRASLDELRRLRRDHAGEVELVGYHDPGEVLASVGA